MKVTGIVAEFNPFHNGHNHLLSRAKSETGADFIVVVMSGNFTQRGIPAFINKYERTEFALLCGADLVLELPVSYSSSTAEAFAYGSISILNSLGVVTDLLFGSESGDVSILKACAKNIISPSKSHEDIIKKYLSEGLSFPGARAMAYPEYSTLLNTPNNILGLEYIKALSLLNSAINPHTIAREGNSYHDTTLSTMASADAIRNLFISADSTDDQVFETLSQSIPSALIDKYKENYKKTWPIYSDDFSQYLNYALLTSSSDQLSNYQDINSDIADRILNNLNDFETFSKYTALIKTKELTYTRISRALLHAMLNLKDLTRDANGNLMECPYTRILGFKSSSRELLHEIKKTSTIPLLTKEANYKSILPEHAFEYYETNANADSIYNSIVKNKYGTHLKDGCQISPIII